MFLWEILKLNSKVIILVNEKPGADVFLPTRFLLHSRPCQMNTVRRQWRKQFHLLFIFAAHCRLTFLGGLCLLEKCLEGAMGLPIELRGGECRAATLEKTCVCVPAASSVAFSPSAHHATSKLNVSVCCILWRWWKLFSGHVKEHAIGLALNSYWTHSGK